MAEIRQLIDKDEKQIFPITVSNAVMDKDGKSVGDSIDELNQNLTFDGNYVFRVGLDGDGNPGYYKADGSLNPFKSFDGTNAEVWCMTYYASSYIVTRFFGNTSTRIHSAGTHVGQHTSQTVAGGTNITVTALKKCIAEVYTERDNYKKYEMEVGDSFTIIRQGYTATQHAVVITYEN